MNARAEFIISSAIIEFTNSSARQQDIELISRSEENDYIVSEVSEIINAGLSNEARKLIDDPAESWLLVTPDKTLLSPASRKILRFVLLKEPDDKEHIYRVAVKPVIKGVESKSLVGLKILIGYEVLVIIRPEKIQTNYTATRQGNILTIQNHGNSNILFQNGTQCESDAKCKMPPVKRVYPNESATIELPLAKPVTYSVWDGATNTERKFE